jgi:bacterial/archaeal transporter family-2 protein
VNFLSYVIAVLAGSASPVQAGASSQLNKDLASPMWAALCVYASGLAGVLLFQLVLREAWPAHKLIAGAHWWAWTGGILSIALTMTGLTLAHKMGSGLYTGLTLTASLLTSVLLDHFGLMGFKQHPVTGMRGLGAGLLIAGIWLIAKF